jgi:hypothetical protein
MVGPATWPDGWRAKNEPGKDAGSPRINDRYGGD